jgi:hypothetical protein
MKILLNKSCFQTFKDLFNSSVKGVAFHLVGLILFFNSVAAVLVIRTSDSYFSISSFSVF